MIRMLVRSFEPLSQDNSQLTFHNFVYHMPNGREEDEWKKNCLKLDENKNLNLLYESYLTASLLHCSILKQKIQIEIFPLEQKFDLLGIYN